MTYHKKSHPHRPWTTTLNFAYGNARLVTLAPGLRPERRFAPLARGLTKGLFYSWDVRNQLRFGGTNLIGQNSKQKKVFGTIFQIVFNSLTLLYMNAQ